MSLHQQPCNEQKAEDWAVSQDFIGSHGLELAPQVWAVILLGIAGLFFAWRYCIPKTTVHIPVSNIQGKLHLANRIQRRCMRYGRG